MRGELNSRPASFPGRAALLSRSTVINSEIVIERSKSHSSIRLSIPLLMLGVCVFLWGFSYKLSLYDLQQRTLHRVPDAKLLSKNEDSRAADGVHQVLASAAFPQQALFFQLAVLTIAIAWACSRGRLDLDASSSGDAKLLVRLPRASLYFRPPPIPFAL